MAAIGSSSRTHCLSPSRVRPSLDAAIGPASEAAVTTSGDRLGPVGGRIVAEVIVTLLDRDPGSVRFADPAWEPRRLLIDLLRARS
jgi:hypothetical protein